MFIGHYAPAYALKGAVPKTSLALLFIATQFVDILFFPFVNMGIERLKIVPHYTASTHFDLEYYPFTHGLLATILWGGLFYLLFRYVFPSKSRSKAVAWAMALGLVSHWFADLIVHTPDLPLWSDASPKVGFGLWNYKNATFATEVILLLLGFGFYMRKTRVVSSWGKIGPYVLLGLLLLAGYLNLYVLPPAEDTMSLMTLALVSYFLFAAIAWATERGRVALALEPARA